MLSFTPFLAEVKTKTLPVAYKNDYLSPSEFLNSGKINSKTHIGRLLRLTCEQITLKCDARISEERVS